MSVEGSNLVVDVGYSGGCGEHQWSLCWDEAFSTEEMDGEELKQVELTLLHQTNDTCEMFKTDDLSFSLDLLGMQPHKIVMGELSVVYRP